MEYPHNSLDAMSANEYDCLRQYWPVNYSFYLQEPLVLCRFAPMSIKCTGIVRYLCNIQPLPTTALDRPKSGIQHEFRPKAFVGIPEIAPVGSAVSTMPTQNALFSGSTGYIKGRSGVPGVLYMVHCSFLAKTVGSDGRMRCTQWGCMALSAIGFRSKGYGSVVTMLQDVRCR